MLGEKPTPLLGSQGPLAKEYASLFEFDALNGRLSTCEAEIKQNTARFNYFKALLGMITKALEKNGDKEPFLYINVSDINREQAFIDYFKKSPLDRLKKDAQRVLEKVEKIKQLQT